MTDTAVFEEEGWLSRLREALRRRLIRLCGLGLIGLSALGLLALGTWSVNDPSFSYATDGATRNLLGFPGAAFADLAMQIFGVCGIILCLLPAVWGFTVVRLRSIHKILTRIALALAATVFLTAALAALPAPARWPLPTGLGGLIGELFIYAADTGLGLLIGGLAKPVFGAIAAVAGILFFLFAFGVGRFRLPEDTSHKDRASRPRRAPSRRTVAQPEDHDEDEFEDDVEKAGPPALLGAVMHEVLSAKARLRRLFARRRDAMPDLPMVPGHDGRIEPVFGDGFRMDDMGYDEDNAIDVTPHDVHEQVLGAPRPGRVMAQAAAPKPSRRGAREAQASLLPNEGFQLPPLHFLSEPKAEQRDASLSEDALEQNARLLEGVLDDFGVRGEITQVRPGPVVTLYELEPAPGTKSSRVISLADDIARSMSAVSARVAVIPGRNAIGIELPNAKRQTVYLRELLASKDFDSSKSKLALCVGKTIGGEPVIADLARMPHLLIAGTTGSGKSVAINTMVLSILYRMPPERCRLIMVDPKMLELSVYDGIPHLLTPVVTDPKKAVVALKWAVREMEDRYKKMSKLGVRNIDGYNSKLAEAEKRGETLSRTVQTGFDRETGEAIFETEELDYEPMPFLVVIVDEMADLMMVAGKDIEGAIQRLAQMARAAGIHLIMATQRPSVDVITGTIKANFPTRISFQVTSKIDSRTILGEQGAEQLLGMGDMLYMMGGGRIRRCHGPFVSDEEVEEVVAFLKSQGTPEYLDAVTEEDGGDDGAAGDGAIGNLSESDDLYDKAVAIVLRDRKVSTSYIQRRLSIGYNRAATLIERMEQEGLIGAANHAGKREILVPSREEAEAF